MATPIPVYNFDMEANLPTHKSDTLQSAKNKLESGDYGNRHPAVMAERGPIMPTGKPPHKFEDYEESEHVYANAGEQQPLQRKSSVTASIVNIIGFRDVCGNKRLWKMLMAEFIGTLFLVLIGCGSCLSGWSKEYAPTQVQIALAFGISVATMAAAIGHVSGCNINPAVSVGLFACGKMSFLKTIVYIIAQCLGGICGAAILQAVTPTEIQGNLGMTVLNEKLDAIQGLFLEALITFVLVLTVCGVCDELRSDVKGSSPLAIGLSITMCHLMAIQYTGSSMNPARTLGPAVITKIWAHHWIYWCGPLLGGFVAGFIYNVSFKERSQDTIHLDDMAEKRLSRGR